LEAALIRLRRQPQHRNLRGQLHWQLPPGSDHLNPSVDKLSALGAPKRVKRRVLPHYETTENSIPPHVLGNFRLLFCGALAAENCSLVLAAAAALPCVRSMAGLEARILFRDMSGTETYADFSFVLLCRMEEPRVASSRRTRLDTSLRIFLLMELFAHLFMPGCTLWWLAKVQWAF
jgi:hypothetical protein